MKTNVFLTFIILILFSYQNKSIETKTDKELIDNFTQNVIINGVNNYEELQELEKKYSEIKTIEDKTNGKEALHNTIKEMMYAGKDTLSIKKTMHEYYKIEYSEEAKKIYNKMQEAINKNINPFKLIKYFGINNDSVNKNTKIIEVINLNILAIKEQVKVDKWKSYQTIHYSEIKNKSKIKSSRFYNNLNYSDLDKLYFTIFDDKENRVVFL